MYYFRPDQSEVERVMLTQYYDGFFASHPLVTGNHIDNSQPKQEVLVSCKCGYGYRIMVNGENPIPVSSIEGSGVVCPNCGVSVKDWNKLSGHSAGFFNASVWRET